MLPAGLNDEYIDKVIQPIVFTINKIPSLHTQTTCQGHIWYDCPVWPTKSGWIHYFHDKDKFASFDEMISTFCEEREGMELDNRGEFGNIAKFTICNYHQPHWNDGGHHNMDDETEAKEFFTLAEAREKIMHQYWDELADVVKYYVFSELGTLDLPYRMAK